MSQRIVPSAGLNCSPSPRLEHDHRQRKQQHACGDPGFLRGYDPCILPFSGAGVASVLTRVEGWLPPEYTSSETRPFPAGNTPRFTPLSRVVPGGEQAAKANGVYHFKQVQAGPSFAVRTGALRDPTPYGVAPVTRRRSRSSHGSPEQPFGIPLRRSVR